MSSVTDKVPVKWVPRKVPLAPSAVAARGTSAKNLVRRLLVRSSEALLKLRGVYSGDLVIIAAQESDLPWVDGAFYLGREDGSSIYVPTNIQASAPPGLLENAIREKFPHLLPPFAIIVSPPAVVPMANQLQLSSDALTKWLESN